MNQNLSKPTEIKDLCSVKKVTKNLKFRLLLGLFFFLFVIFYLFGYFLVASLKNSYLESTDAKLGVIIKDISHDYKHQSDADTLLGDAKEEFDIQTLYVQLSTLDTQTHTVLPVSASFDLKNEPMAIDARTIENVLMTRKIVFTTVHHAKKTLRVAHMILDAQAKMPLILSCALQYEYHTPYLKQLKEWLWMGLGIVLSVILLMVYFIISKSFSNVQNVIDEVRSINIEETYKTIKQSHVSPEIDNLIDTFNALLTELSTAYTQVKAFGHNASHELKTPLTIMRGEIEIGLKKERSQEEYQKILASIHHEVISLQSVIEKILFLSSVTKQGLHASFEDIYMDELIHEVLEEKRMFAQQKAIDLEISTCEPITIRGNAVLLKILLNNLVENAIKYAAHTTTVRIALFQGSVYIKNSGIVISEEEISHIFERFYRGKQVGSISGSGLGLALVKAIADLHGFRIDVQSTHEETVFTLNL